MGVELREQLYAALRLQQNSQRLSYSANRRVLFAHREGRVIEYLPGEFHL